jgi:hypothetical protein
MPGVTEALRDLAKTNIKTWTETVIAEFINNLRDEKQLANVLKDRESLKKVVISPSASGTAIETRIPFPTGDTTTKEIDSALEAINRGDNSVYRQDPRPPFLFGEEEFGLTRIQALITPADILCYEAAAFVALATVEDHQKITAAYFALLPVYPYDDAEINAARNTTIALIKKRLAKELAETEYEEALARIIENPEIPAEDKEQSIVREHRNHSRELDLASLIDEIQWLKEEHDRIKTHLDHLVRGYEALKQTLRDFVPTIPESLKREGQTILADLGGAEERQAPSLLASTGSALMSEFLAKAQTQIRAMTERCEEIERFLSQTSEDPFIRPAYKEAFNAHLSTFNAGKHAIPVDQQLAQAEVLRKEGEEAYKKEQNQQELERLQAELTSAKEALRSLLTDPKIPQIWREGAQALMDRTSANEYVIAANNLDQIIRLSKKITADITLINQKITTALGRLRGLASDERIGARFREQAQALLTSTSGLQPTLAYDQLLSKAEEILSTVAALRDQDALEKRKTRLQQIVDNSRIPEDLKALARQLLIQPNPEEVAITITVSKIELRIKQISNVCQAVKEKLSAELSGLGRPYSYYSKTGGYFYYKEASSSLETFELAMQAQTPWAELERIATNLNKEIIAIKAYKKMHTLLDRIEAMRQHADSMPQGSEKRTTIHALVRNLQDQIKTYLGQIRTAENPSRDVQHQAFESEFKKTLLNKDTMKVMQQYRTPGKLIANIVLACTVFGAIVLLIRAAIIATRQLQQKEKPSLTLNQVGLFAKTRSERDIEAINDALQAARPTTQVESYSSQPT